MQLQRRYMRWNDSKNRVLFSKNLFSANDIVFYSNGFQAELIDSTQPDNQIVLAGDSSTRNGYWLMWQFRCTWR